MTEDVARRVLEHPQFKQLTASRNRFSWTLAAVVLAVYYAFVLTVAFAPGSFASPLSQGMTWSVGLTLFIVINTFCFVLTGVYVYRANAEFDRMVNTVLREVGA